MAEAKTTKGKKAKVEKPVEELKEELLEQAKAEKRTEEDTPAEEQVIDLHLEKNPYLVGEGVDEGGPSNIEEETPLVDSNETVDIDPNGPVAEEDPLDEVEKTVEKFEEVTKELDEKVAELGTMGPEKAGNAAKETLNEIIEMENALRKEIEEEEKALTERQKKGMRRWLGDFWNGVSSGWDN